MRGKKINTEFVVNYIASMATKGHVSPEQIVAQANQDIKDIDEKIKEAELVKKFRSGLVDVVETLAPTVEDNSEEVTILNFYKVKNFAMAISICDLIVSGVVNLDTIKKSQKGDDVLFIMKELLEISVLKRNGKNIEKGKIFDEFLSYAKKRYAR